MAKRPPLAQHFALDPSVTFLNHGSFGATPLAVLEAQSQLRARLEREPVRFMVEDLEQLLDESRATLADFLDAPAGSLAFVPNATAGVNAVLRSIEHTLEPGDELLTTSHAYNACANTLRFAASRSGARVVVADIPIPLSSESDIIDPILAAASPRTKLALIDHVASPTAIILPIHRIVPALEERGIPTLVDGAHAPGMLDLSVNSINPAYYTGNCHKWIGAPKGAGFLYARHDMLKDLHPAIISHGLNSRRTDRAPFLLEFDWTGTDDPTPYLCVRHAIEHMASLLPGGWPDIRKHNTALARRARAILIDTLALTPVAPETMSASIASLILPPAPADTLPPASALYADPLQQSLVRDHAIQVPVIPFPKHPSRLIRLSAQVYNHEQDYHALATALETLLESPHRAAPLS